MTKSAGSSVASQNGLRTPERMFRAVLWVVAVIFAGFPIVTPVA